jgi:Tfp pilus assembly protein PilW
MPAPRASFPRPARRRAAFSLVEIMIGASIGSFVLLGILTAFVTLGRNGARLYNYNTMETESRRALDEFSQDVRMASGIVWNSASSVTLTVPDNYAAYGNQVTYAYDSATTGATRRTFYRVPGNPSTTYVHPAHPHRPRPQRHLLHLRALQPQHPRRPGHHRCRDQAPSGHHEDQRHHRHHRGRHRKRDLRHLSPPQQALQLTAA